MGDPQRSDPARPPATLAAEVRALRNEVISAGVGGIVGYWAEDELEESF